MMPGSNTWPAGKQEKRGTEMTIEVLDMRIIDKKSGLVRLIARDVSEEHLQYLERYRDDGFEEDLTYEWFTQDQKQFNAMKRWLKMQKATNTAKTFGEAMRAVEGIITQSPAGKYRVWE